MNYELRTKKFESHTHEIITKEHIKENITRRILKPTVVRTVRGQRMAGNGQRRTSRTFGIESFRAAPVFAVVVHEHVVGDRQQRAVHRDLGRYHYLQYMGNRENGGWGRMCGLGKWEDFFRDSNGVWQKKEKKYN